MKYLCSNINKCDRMKCPHDTPHEGTFGCLLPCCVGGTCAVYTEPDSVQMELELNGKGGSDGTT